jgi:DNA-binding response OmpR family regulator
MYVLLVEDDTMIGEVIRDTLKDESYTVDLIQDGLAVASTLKAQPDDLILLALGLPGKDGQDVLSSLRARHELSNAGETTQSRLRVTLTIPINQPLMKPGNEQC